MQPIKDYIVLDFLEWLKRRKSEYLFIDRLGYDEEYEYKIEGYAKEYINDIKRIYREKESMHSEVELKAVLKSFIDSYEFDRLFGRGCTFYKQNIEQIISDFCKNLVRHVYCSSDDVENTLLCYYWKVYYNNKKLDENYLIDSIKVYYRYFDKFRGKNFCKSEAAIVEEFLDYLDKRNVRLNIKTIPRNHLKRVVHQYNNTKFSDELIVNILKDRMNQKMITLLKNKMSNDKLARYKDLGYLYDRYNDDDVQYKCLLLPLKGETNLEMFITKYWDDLDIASSNYLDIFVSKNDIQLTGYTSLEKITNFDFSKEIELPCILIWKDQMTDVRFINIRGLDFSQLYACIQKIINLIKKEYVFDDIVNKAKYYINDCKEENKQRIVIQQTVNENHGIIIGMQTEEIDFAYLYLSEIQMAINKLEKLDLEPIIKKRSIGILHNLRKAIKKKSDADFLVCKDKFKKYIVGNGAELIVDVLKEFYYISLCLDLENKMGKKDEK